MKHTEDIATAILVFANSPGEEVKHKPIPGGEALFDAMTDSTLRVVASTGIPYFHFTEEHQKGDNFGERLTGALKTLFLRGYSNIIVVGNDSPQLIGKHFVKALGYLEKDQFVLGPTKDGGCYLLGLKKAHFNALEWQGLPWQGKQLCVALSLLIEKHGHKVHRLELLLDLDTAADLSCMAEDYTRVPRRIVLLICRILQKSNEILTIPVFHFQSGSSRNFFNKGSPILP